ncbi:hypothetical protein [Paenibacillus koleovorans]|uniref:hypothetical protein n=1 Tax=Paenibacillus koleovorans TaxID=121608 RepID=UPI000FDC1F4A|nr:hypothetical protein [Paenibacillus koleovorans]
MNQRVMNQRGSRRLVRLGWLSLCVLLLASLLVGCSGKPPMPSIKVGKTTVHVERSTYSWRAFTSSVVADYPGPVHQIDLDTEATLIPNPAPDAKVLIVFTQKPKRILLTRWVNGTAEPEVEINGASFPLPTASGAHLFSIRAEWRQGGGSYAFAVKIP